MGFLRSKFPAGKPGKHENNEICKANGYELTADNFTVFIKLFFCTG